MIFDYIIVGRRGNESGGAGDDVEEEVEGHNGAVGDRLRKGSDDCRTMMLRISVLPVKDPYYC